MIRYLPTADVVHVRCPANIPLFAIILLSLWRIPGQRRWIKYAGNWKPTTRGSWSYTFQRWLLKTGWHGAQVTVNGHWDEDPAFVHSFINPCLTDDEWREGAAHVREKELDEPLRLIFVGRVERAKGVERALMVLAKLNEAGLPAICDFIGDGPERAELEARAAELGVANQALFHGWLPRTELAPYFQQAHLMLFPTISEGWPKVISEAMAYGVVPLAGAIGSIPQFLAECGTGQAIDPLNVDGFTYAIMGYVSDPGRWRAESLRASESSQRFTYTSFLADVRRVLGLNGQ